MNKNIATGFVFLAILSLTIGILVGSYYKERIDENKIRELENKINGLETTINNAANNLEYDLEDFNPNDWLSKNQTMALLDDLNDARNQIIELRNDVEKYKNRRSGGGSSVTIPSGPMS